MYIIFFEVKEKKNEQKKEVLDVNCCICDCNSKNITTTFYC